MEQKRRELAIARMDQKKKDLLRQQVDKRKAEELTRAKQARDMIDENRRRVQL